MHMICSMWKFEIFIKFVIVVCLKAGAREVRVSGSTDPLKFEIGVKKLIPHLCRTGDF